MADEEDEVNARVRVRVRTTRGVGEGGSCSSVCSGRFAAHLKFNIRPFYESFGQLCVCPSALP